MANFYEVSTDELKIGISMSRRNALRLARDAAVLLEHGPSRASVYGQWHLAVEELGKSWFLEDCGTKPLVAGKVQIPKHIFGGGSHEQKFAAGLALLPKTQGSTFGFTVTVTQNTLMMAKTFKDPDGAGVSVGIGQTGKIKDTTHAGTKPSHKSRLRLLYVDFRDGQWSEPESELRNAEIVAKTSISSADLKQAIDELLSVL
jgi:AbiV family abortive infection protein